MKRRSCPPAHPASGTLHGPIGPYGRAPKPRPTQDLSDPCPFLCRRPCTPRSGVPINARWIVPLGLPFSGRGAAGWFAAAEGASGATELGEHGGSAGGPSEQEGDLLP